MHKRIQAVWAGAPMFGRVRFGTQEVHIDCDPVAALSLRDLLFPLLDSALPDATPSVEEPVLSVEWWQGGTFLQRYSLHPEGRVARVVPGRDDSCKQLDEAARTAVEAGLRQLTEESLRAGCP